MIEGVVGRSSSGNPRLGTCIELTVACGRRLLGNVVGAATPRRFDIRPPSKSPPTLG